MKSEIYPFDFRGKITKSFCWVMKSDDSGAGGIANPFVEAWKVWLPKEASVRKQDLTRKLEKQKVHSHSVSNLCSTSPINARRRDWWMKLLGTLIMAIAC